MERYRKIAVHDFYDYGQHIYEDQLGFDEDIRYAARSNVSKTSALTGNLWKRLFIDLTY